MRGWIAQTVAMVFAAWLIAGCESRVKGLDSSSPNPSPLRPVINAPEAIRKAAEAVVRIGLLGTSSGTGAFIKHDSKTYLVTNFHVLGRKNCPKEGCYIRLAFHYEQGKARQLHNVFVSPRWISPDLDAAIYAAYQVDPSTGLNTAFPFDPPFALTLRPLSVQSLQEKAVHVLGHPYGCLKEVSSGVVSGTQGRDWFIASTLSFPGNSGSPILDSEGYMIGLAHHAAPAAFGVAATVGTSGEAIARMLQSTNSHTDLLFSTHDLLTPGQVVDRQAAFRLAKEPRAKVVGEGHRTVLSLLSSACEHGLTQKRFDSPEAIDRALSPCSSALNWISCGPSEPGLEFLTCPMGTDKTEWQSRFKRAARRAHLLSRPGVYDWLTFYPAHLEDSPMAAGLAASKNLAEFVDEHKPSLTFELAYYILLFAPFGSVDDYRGVSVLGYVQNYRNRTHYPFHYDWIFASHRELFRSEKIRANDFVNELNLMLKDKNLPPPLRQKIKALAYDLGWLS